MAFLTVKSSAVAAVVVVHAFERLKQADGKILVHMCLSAGEALYIQNIHNYCHLSKCKDAMFGIITPLGSSPTPYLWHCHMCRDPMMYLRN